MNSTGRMGVKKPPSPTENLRGKKDSSEGVNNDGLHFSITNCLRQKKSTFRDRKGIMNGRPNLMYKGDILTNRDILHTKAIHESVVVLRTVHPNTNVIRTNSYTDLVLLRYMLAGALPLALER